MFWKTFLVLINVKSLSHSDMQNKTGNFGGSFLF